MVIGHCVDEGVTCRWSDRLGEQSKEMECTSSRPLSRCTEYHSWTCRSVSHKLLCCVSHATKLSNFVTQLCCTTYSDIVAWLRKLPNFWRVAQLICRIETISILGQFLALLLSCDWSIVCLHVNWWFCCKLLTYYLLYISCNISCLKSKLIYR